MTVTSRPTGAHTGAMSDDQDERHTQDRSRLKAPADVVGLVPYLLFVLIAFILFVATH